MRSSSAFIRSTAIVVAAERDIAGETQRTAPRGLRIGALGQPGNEGARIVGLDPRRSFECDARGRDAEAPAETHLRDAGRAQIEALDVPGYRRRISSRR